MKDPRATQLRDVMTGDWPLELESNPSLGGDGSFEQDAKTFSEPFLYYFSKIIRKEDKTIFFKTFIVQFMFFVVYVCFEEFLLLCIEEKHFYE